MTKLFFGPIRRSNAKITVFKNEKRQKSIYENMRTYIREIVKTFKKNLFF